MNKQVRNRKPGGPRRNMAQNRAGAKAARRAAAIRAAKARRRRQTLVGALAALAVFGVLVGVFVFFGDRATETDPAGASADPALSIRPTATAGEGDLKELTVTTLIEGQGAAAQNGQWITVNYLGVSYRTGEEFDASWNRSEPFSFPLGQGRVIDGWDQGLVGVKVGSRVQLDIPSELAYGEHGNPSGPLRFIVDVLDVQ